jgi:CheY-like chemotaxis protein
VVCDGEQAVSEFRKGGVNGIDLLLLDVVLPKMSGPAISRVGNYREADGRAGLSTGRSPPIRATNQQCPERHLIAESV